MPTRSPSSAERRRRPRYRESVVRRATPIALACSAAALVLAATSLGATTTFTGQTAQGFPASLRVGNDGLVTALTLRWKADCDRPHKFFRIKTRLRPPFHPSTQHRIAKRAHFNVRNSGGF